MQFLRGFFFLYLLLFSLFGCTAKEKEVAREIIVKGEIKNGVECNFEFHNYTAKVESKNGVFIYTLKGDKKEERFIYLLRKNQILREATEEEREMLEKVFGKKCRYIAFPVFNITTGKFTPLFEIANGKRKEYNCSRANVDISLPSEEEICSFVEG